MMSNAAKNSHGQVFEWMCVFVSLGDISKSGIAESCGNAVFNILRNSQTDPF